METSQPIPVALPFEETGPFEDARAPWRRRRRPRGAPPIDVAGRTDIGLVREVNEDQFLVADLRRSVEVEQASLPVENPSGCLAGRQGKLMMVADGLGGHGGGDLASAIALQAFIHYVLVEMPWFPPADGQHAGELLEGFEHALSTCQERVLAAERDLGRAGRGMGTTLTVAYLVWPALYLVHAGDSRCYLWRRGRLRQLTTDHTVAQRLFDKRLLRPEEYKDSPLRHVLFNAVGGGVDELKPEISRIALEEDDLVLLCTDGLTRHLADDEIADLLQPGAGSGSQCDRLIGAAKQAGGRDNVTVVIARC